MPGEWGIWRGEFDLCRGGVGKIEPEVYGFSFLFWGGRGGVEVANSYKQVFGRD